MPAHPPSGELSRLAALARASRPGAGATRVVAVDGPSGAGKTALAARLAAELGAPTVHMDDLYPGWNGLAEGVQRALRWVVAPLVEGRQIRYRAWDWERDAEGPWVQVPASDVLVIEGCGSAVGALGAAASVRIWVEAAEAVRRARGLARDPGYAPLWEHWAQQERDLYGPDQTWERADVLIDTTGTQTPTRVAGHRVAGHRVQGHGV